MPVTHARMGDEPDSRLTRIANDAAEAIEAHPETTPDVRAIVALVSSEGDQGHGGFCGLNYEDDDGQMASDLVLHLEAMLAVYGLRVMIVPILEDGPVPPGLS